MTNRPLKISDVTSTPTSVTNDSEQKLTCHISGLNENQPVTVTWKDPVGNIVSNDSNYSQDAGTADTQGCQEAVLTIKQVKMQTYTSNFTYKCSVKSSQYPDSPPSPELDVVANIIGTTNNIPIKTIY